MIRSFLLALSAALMLTLAGCASSDADYSSDSNPFIRSNHRAAEALLAQLPATGSTLIIATVVNIDALERSSTLGRLISEQVSSRFTQAGQRMIEMKFRNSVYISQTQGELMLTRELHELASTYAAQAVIVGSYAESKDYVYVNLKVIQPNSNAILAVHDYALPLDNNVRALLRDRRY